MAFLLADLGGTNLVMGLCDDAGTALGPLHSIPTGAQRYPNELLCAWKEALINVCGQTPVQALLMGIPTKECDGLLTACNNLPTLSGLPLRKLLSQYLGMPVCLFPDSACYAAGAFQKYCKDKKSVLIVTLGTGVGAAWILDGFLYEGNGMTGEMWIAPYQDANLEDVLSASGLLSRCPASSVAELAERALHGDSAAEDAFKAYGEALGFFLCYAIGMMDPECIIIGGGIAKGHKCFESAMNSIISKHTVRSCAQIQFCDQDDGWLALYGAYLLNAHERARTSHGTHY